jgi:hypothetical protein
MPPDSPKMMKTQLEGGQSCPQPAFSRLGRLKGGCGQDWPSSSVFSAVPYNSEVFDAA